MIGYPCTSMNVRFHRVFLKKLKARSFMCVTLIVGLAIVGQFVYQLCFMGGIARTSVATARGSVSTRRPTRCSAGASEGSEALILSSMGGAECNLISSIMPG